MANEANIKAVITADDRASATLKNFGDNVGTTSAKMGMLLRTAAAGAAAAGAAAVAFGVASVKAFSESEDMIAQTNAVLKSTGQIAGVTADQVTKLATALQKTTKFSDEQVRSTENLLLTFTSIGKDIFPQATKAVLDMATALGEDTKSASIQLGKALQDPVLGITALRRVGVNFSDAQKDVIQNLVDTNQKAEAQKLILKELQVEFGGSAEAAGKTFSGSLERLKNQLNDVEETIGHTITNALQPFAAEASNFVASVDWQVAINNTLNALSQLWQFINTNFMPSLEALWNTFAQKILPSLQNLWNALNPALTDAFKLVGVELWLYINTLNVFYTILSTIINIISQLISWIGNLTGALINAGKTIVTTFTGIADAIVAPFKAAFNAISSLWNKSVGKIKLNVPSWVPGIGGKGFDIPNIPMLAEGGIVTKPTLAMIGEAGAEAVVPLNKPGMNPGGSINVNINVGALMGTDVEARKFAQIILGHLKDSAASRNMSLGQMIG